MRKGRTRAKAIWLVLIALLLGTVLAGCSSSSGETGEEGSAASPFGNVDLANSRDAESLMAADSVSRLERAWSLPLGSQGEGLHYIASPVVSGGVAYIQDPESNVEAIDLESGEVLWEKPYRVLTGGAHGVIVADGKVFGATPSSAFALDAKSGKELWSVKLVRRPSELIRMAPGFHDGLVYVSTAPSGAAGDVGVLWALDAQSGKKIWNFDTVPRGLWGHPEVNYGGGVYYPPAFDGEGSMYVGVSHAGPIPGTAKYPWGSSRPGPNLYSNSIVKLDEKTGKVEWHYQITPHGLCNGFTVSPVLAESRGREVVLSAGVLGILVAVDQETGELLWRRPLGKHNGHDNDGLKAMRGEYASLKMPMTVFPGTYGGVSAPMSVKGSTVFVPLVNGGTRLFSQTTVKELGVPSGELVAVDVGSGAIKWKRRFSSSLFGPTTVTNDLVFATSFDGTLAAFEMASGKEVWRKKLPVAVEGGMAITGGTLLVRAGSPSTEIPELVAYRLSG